MKGEIWFGGVLNIGDCWEVKENLLNGFEYDCWFRLVGEDVIWDVIFFCVV